MIEVSGLSKQYGEFLAVDSLTFKINKGEIVGLLGPNGAGKSTTMNMVTGYLAPSSGTVSIKGFDIMEDPLEARREIGYLPELPPLYSDMRVSEYLHFAGELKGVPSRQIKSQIDRSLEVARLGGVQKRLIGNLSKGYKQRVGLAQALMGRPSLLILDEPTVGLDPKQIIDIRDTIRTLSEDHTIILSSHILSEVSQICQRALILDQGKLVADESMESIHRGYAGHQGLQIRLEGDPERAFSLLDQIPGVDSVEILPTQEDDFLDLLITSKEGVDIRREIFKVCSRNDMTILLMRPRDRSLEDIFLHLTNKGAR